LNDAEREVVVVDALGEELILPRLPQRIVSLVPSITETVIDLGASARLVGITTYCTHPQSVVASIPKVGGTKGFSFRKIDSLTPDLVIANKEENRKQQIEKLRKKYPVFVTYPRTVEDAIKMVADLGVLTATSAMASKFIATCQQLLAAIGNSALGRPLRTGCMIWRDPWMAAGADSYASALLGRVGFTNVYNLSAGRYPETSLQTVFERNPDVIILPDEPYEFGEQDKQEVESFFSERGKSIRVLLMDGSYLTWFGTRTLKGLRHLRQVKSKLCAKA